jgi:hypothetical protein
VLNVCDRLCVLGVSKMYCVYVRRICRINGKAKQLELLQERIAAAEAKRHALISSLINK